MAEDLVITVERIDGNCPVYHSGDQFSIRQGYILDSKIDLCLHGLASLMPFYTSLARGISAKELGLGVGADVAHIQCVDPCRLTGGGTVIFKIERGRK